MKKLLLIRHAESVYNEHLSNLKLNGVKIKDENLLLLTNFRKEERLYDPLLSLNGHKQIESCKNNFQQLLSRIKLVISTCMSRTLETTKELLEKVNEKYECVVIPSFERLDSISDFPFRNQINIKRYSGFNFNLVHKEIEKFGSDWFLHQLANPYKKELFLQAVRNRKLHSFEEGDLQKYHAIIEIAKKFAVTGIETNYEYYFRYELTKRIISHIIQQPSYKNLKDNEIALITHWNFLVYITSSTYDSSFWPHGFISFDNCEIQNFNFNTSNYLY